MRTKKKLQFEDFVSESVLRDIILFSLLFILAISQDWENILLFLFPLITFTFALFFKLTDIIRQKNQNKDTFIIYTPLGSEKISSQRLFFSSFIQIVLLFWFGAESLYHPQLIDEYYVYFSSIFIFFYTFGFFSIFIDLWKYSKMKLILEKSETDNSNMTDHNLENVFSFLKVKSFKIISIINLLVFIILNILNILFNILIANDLMPGFEYDLPGTGIENAEPIKFSFFIYIIIVLPPLISIGFLFINYRDITNFDREKLNKIISSLPISTQTKIINNLTLLNEKFRNKLRLE